MIVYYIEEKNKAGLRMKRILVTGGAGYIGSHVAKELKLAGYEPVIFDNLFNGYISLTGHNRFYRGDLTDKDRIFEVAGREKPLAVMHFAALNIVGDSYSNPIQYFENNITGAVNLLHAMVKNNIRYFIFSSTASVYGEPEYLPINEKHPTKPLNPYGKSKLFIEEMLSDLDLSYGLKSISLRYFNAAGADKSGELGEAHQPETHLIPIILDIVTGKRKHLDIFGDDYDTPDGTCIRDYIHITDLSRAHLLSLDYLLSNNKSDVFNLGSETGYSVKEIISAVRSITGKDIKTRISPRRKGDPSRLIADSSKITSLLGWKPAHTLEDMIQSAYDWHKNKDRLIRKY